eukprot:scaffold10064_cov130-Isochrysis_galbana.AAC.8
MRHHPRRVRLPEPIHRQHVMLVIAGSRLGGGTCSKSAVAAAAAGASGWRRRTRATYDIALPRAGRQLES